VRFRRSDWTRRGGFFLRQVGNSQLHRALDRDASNAFILVDPAISRQSLFRFLARSLQIFHAFFCARFFIIASTRPWTNYGEHDHTEKHEKQHDPKPRG
jgi:hypothetical protein